MLKKKKTYFAYVLKFNSNRHKQVNFFNKFKQRKMALFCSQKIVSITKRNYIKKNGNFYCLNCLHSFRTKNKPELHKRACKNKDFCSIIMPSGDTKILKYDTYQKSDKAPFIIYADLECIIEKIQGCKNNPKNSFTTKVSKHIPSGFSMPTVSSFKRRENKHGIYRGKDYMKNCFELLRECAIKIINFKKKKMKLLPKEQQESFENPKICNICKEKFKNKYLKDKRYHKVRDHCHYTGEYRGSAHSICNLELVYPKIFL